MADSKKFKEVLQVAYQIGAEKVANKDTTPSRKGPFSFGIYGELKEEIVARGIEPNELTENESNAIIFAFCTGWNVEVSNRL